MLEDGALFFPNAVSFPDPFEGSVPLRNVQERVTKLTIEFDSPTPFKEAFERLTKRPGVIFSDADNFVESQVRAKRELRDGLIAKHPQKQEALRAWIAELNFDSLRHYWDRQNIFISCWHESEWESAAMWKLYSNNDHSVCVTDQSTKHLTHALNAHDETRHTIAVSRGAGRDSAASDQCGARWHEAS